MNNLVYLAVFSLLVGLCGIYMLTRIGSKHHVHDEFTAVVVKLVMSIMLMAVGFMVCSFTVTLMLLSK